MVTAMNKRKRTPKTYDELVALLSDPAVRLADVDISAITDLSHLFDRNVNQSAAERKDFSGIET